MSRPLSLPEGWRLDVTPEVDSTNSAVMRWAEAGEVEGHALRADVQSRALEVKAYQVMSNLKAKSSPHAPKLSSLKLIDYDFKKYGSSAERKRLLKKWDDEVKSLPK